MPNPTITTKMQTSIIVLRILIGWHFLYEGVIKIFNPDWTAFGYLASSQGPLEPMFTSLAQSGLIDWVDTLNAAALLFVGITLILGFLEKKGALAGIVLLAMYYLAHPPLPWLQQFNVEGNYWFVNKNLIELFVCVLLYHYPTGSIFGLGFFLKKNQKPAKIKKT